MESSSVAELVTLLVLLVFLYNVSTTFRYFFKWSVFIVLSAFFATVFIPIMLWRPRDWRNALWPAWGARQISHLFGLSWELRGSENILRDQGCVILINHQSMLDLLVLAELWPVMERCTVISKKEIFYMWPFGLAAWLWGTIFIDRLHPEKAQDTINKTANIVKEKKAKLCMFPEGTRYNGDSLLPFKKGAFHVAIASQIPLQPVVVSRYTFLDGGKKRFDSAPNIISILPPIPTESLDRDDVEKLAASSRKIMDDQYHKISQEIQQKA